MDGNILFFEGKNIDMNPYVLRNIVAECFCVSIWKDTLGILIFIKNNVVTMENLNGNGTILAFFA